MADIDDVLERLVTDPAFRARVAADPSRALAGYALSPADLDLLSTRAAEDISGAIVLEARINRSTLAGLFLDGFQADDHADADDKEPTASDEPATEPPAIGADTNEPLPVDQALLTDVEQWCDNADPARPMDAAACGEALGIGSDELAERVLSAFDVATAESTTSDFLQAVRGVVLGGPRERIAFAFRLHDWDDDGVLTQPDLVRMMTLGLSEDRAAVPTGAAERLASALWRDAGALHTGAMTFDDFLAAVMHSPAALELITHSAARWLAPNEDVLARLAHPRSRRMRALRTLQNQTAAVVVLVAWAVANVALFAYAVDLYADQNVLVRLARGGGACLNLNGALILIPMMRRLLTRVRRSRVGHALPVDSAVTFHRIVGSTMFAFALLHTAAHVLNYAVSSDMTAMGELLTTLVGFSGTLLLAVFTVMWVFSRKRVRGSARFPLFYGTHLLYLGWFALALIHAPNFWLWATVPIAGFAAEQILRRARRHPAVDVPAGHALRSGTTRLAIDRPAGFAHRAGDYLFLRIPAIASHEWHPFTISSAPERHRISVHVRALGDWTTTLRTTVERHADPTPLTAHLDGPYGAPATHIVDARNAVLIGAGIGVTPFASVLESIVLRSLRQSPDQVTRSVNFFWVNRDLHSFEWFAELLAAVERIDDKHIISSHLFMTGQRDDPAAARRYLSRRIARLGGTPASKLRFRLELTRPDWEKELGDIARRCAPEPVHVFFCGPPGLARTLKRTCADLGMPFRQERF